MSAKVTRCDVEAALARENALLAKVAEDPTKRFLWFWESPQSLVAPRKLSHQPNFERTAAQLAQAGWPVALRSTGGDVTPQGAGIVNITHVYASDKIKRFDIEAAYDALCRPIESALGDGATRGWQPGAFCDGAHNVQWRGLKFAGTAMRFRPCKSDKTRYAVLSHALMLIRPPSAEAIAALNTFLTALDQGRQIDLAAHTGLPPTLTQKDFLDRLVQGFEDLPGPCLDHIVQ